MTTPKNQHTRYDKIISAAFHSHHQPGCEQFEFSRDEIDGKAIGLSVKNIGGLIYEFRYRRPLPASILKCAPANHTWIIEGAGTGRYRFRSIIENIFVPNPNLTAIDIPDRTPDDVLEHGGSKRDEQAILASIAYNRLLDLFLGCRLERKQSHWRTKVVGIGQIEIDDVYVGIDGMTGNKVVVTVQAKKDKDKINSVQITQDIRACEEKSDGRICRPVAVHYETTSNLLACFEFQEIDKEIKLFNERHYHLVKG